MVALEKIPVLNSLTLRNNVGEELADIFEARSIGNFEELIGVNDLKSKERLSSKVLKKASEILDAPDLIEYLTDFQKEYLEEKSRYMSNYAQSKKHILNSKRYCRYFVTNLLKDTMSLMIFLIFLV